MPLPSSQDALGEITAKLDALARAIGGDTLVFRWEAIEQDVERPVRQRTWSRRRVKEALEALCR